MILSLTTQGSASLEHLPIIDRQEAMLRLNIDAVAKNCSRLSQLLNQDIYPVNVSSTLAFSPMRGIGLYSATKSFITAIF